MNTPQPTPHKSASSGLSGGFDTMRTGRMTTQSGDTRVLSHPGNCSP